MGEALNECFSVQKKVIMYLVKCYNETDRLCGLVVRVSGYTTEMYCVSCEVQTEFIYVM
jgi:hypothetical protein